MEGELPQGKLKKSSKITSSLSRLLVETDIPLRVYLENKFFLSKLGTNKVGYLHRDYQKIVSAGH